jgi:putative ABC transport system permease protein
MLRNYLTTALRNLRRQKGYTTTNVFGLTLGIVTCLVIGLYVRHHLQYDRFHDDAERIYRLTRQTVTEGRVTRRQANTPAALGPTLRDMYAGVEASVRIMFPYPNDVLVTIGDQRFYESGFLWADASVFDVFDFPLTQGTPETALNRPYSVVISETLAQRYFGTTDPIGQTLAIQGWTEDEYTVTGVLKDVPETSHLQFTMLGSMTGLDRVYTALFEGEGAWTNSVMYTYIRLTGAAAKDQLTEALPAFTERHLGAFGEQSGVTYRFALQPLTSVHLDADLRTFIDTPVDARYLYLFGAIALLVLAVAGVNFVNLTTAQAARRAREVGIRKAMGSSRGQLIAQFVGEAMLFSALAFLVAMGGTRLAMPILQDAVGITVQANWADPVLWGGGAALVLLMGGLAGWYPALLLSSAQPARALRNRGLDGGRGRRLRQGLIAFQMAVTILLLAGTGVIQQQLDFVRTTSLGFDQEQVVVVPIRDDATRQRADVLKRAWTQHPDVASVTAASGVPGRLMLSDRWPVTRVDGADAPVPLLAMMADPDFVETMDIELVAGRDLSTALPTDQTNAFLLSTSAVQALGFASPQAALGEQVHWQQGEGKTGTVVGVVRDVHTRSLHETIEPMLIHVFPERYSTFALRLRGDDLAGTLDAIEAQWAAHVPGQPFDYAFLDDTIDRLYRTDEQVGRLTGLFAMLAIAIACVGLFGLAAYTAARRRKEIGIRKVLGATAGNVVALLSGEYVRLVGLAFVVAAPLAYLAAQQWLQNFAYRIELGPWLFISAGGLALTVALLTVSTQALRAARVDPAAVIRAE